MSRKGSSPVVASPLVAGLSGGGLILYVYLMVAGREGYQYWAPFAIGGLLTVVALLWPARRLHSPTQRHLASSLTCTLLLAPVPWGPEGTLVPALVAAVFPPLVLLLLFPIGPILTFLTCYSILARPSAARGASAQGAEQ